MTDLMTEAGQTNEGQVSDSSTADLLTGSESVENQQQAGGEQNQQAQEGAATEKPEGAPEKYEFVAPEGKEYDQEVIESFSEAARELNLTQEAAQKMLEKMAPKLADRQNEQVEAIRSEWTAQSKADKEFGGEKISENLAIAKKALDAFGTPELRTLLNDSGLGNHPEIIRAFYRAGKSISEDGYVGASQGAGSAKGLPKDFNGYANALYSDQK